MEHQIATQLVRDGHAPSLAIAKDIVSLFMLSQRPDLSAAYCKVINLHAQMLKRVLQ